MKRDSAVKPSMKKTGQAKNVSSAYRAVTNNIDKLEKSKNLTDALQKVLGVSQSPVSSYKGSRGGTNKFGSPKLLPGIPHSPEASSTLKA